MMTSGFALVALVFLFVVDWRFRQLERRIEALDARIHMLESPRR